MKNKLKLLGIIATMAVIGFTMVSCGDSCPDGGSCEVGHTSNERTCSNPDCHTRTGCAATAFLEGLVIHCDCWSLF